MFKWLFRLAVHPVSIVLKLLEWCGTYILSIVGMLCKLASGIILMLTIVAYLAGIASGYNALNAFFAGFLFYIFPRIGGIIICGIALANASIINWTNG